MAKNMQQENIRNKMNKIILISLVILFAICSRSWALPTCPGSPQKQIGGTMNPFDYWHNCIGIYTWGTKGKYVGKWYNGMFYGRGIKTDV